MVTDQTIIRKYLVRQADLQAIEDLQLSSVRSIYLDPSNIDGLDLSDIVGDLTNNESPVEIELAEVATQGKGTTYFAISRVGGFQLSRAEAITEIDGSTFDRVVSSLGHKELKKSRFSFSYLRKNFDLDVINLGDTLILEANLAHENELFAVPPFVHIIKEVTGNAEYYDYNLANFIEKE